MKLEIDDSIHLALGPSYTKLLPQLLGLKIYKVHGTLSDFVLIRTPHQF